MSDGNSVREIIEQHNAELSRCYLSGDIDTAAQLFAEDCWQMPPHAEPLVGRAAYHAFWRQATGWGDWHFTLDTQEVVEAGDIAVERGVYVLDFRAGPNAPPGFDSAVDRGNYVVLWRREPDGQWRLVWDAPVSTVPLGG